MGRLAVEAVVDRLDGDAGGPPRDILLNPGVVVRRTTGPAHASR
jgi:DNA-binding LacI/PurR family transcriptional regulator